MAHADDLINTAKNYLKTPRRLRALALKKQQTTKHTNIMSDSNDIIMAVQKGNQVEFRAKNGPVVYKVGKLISFTGATAVIQSPGSSSAIPYEIDGRKLIQGRPFAL